MRGSRLLVALAPVVLALSVGACTWDLGKLFDRDDPQVESARRALEASTAGADADLPAAREALEEVLRWRCDVDGGHDLVVDRPNASLDLGLVLFRLSELVGRRFGEEELGADGGEEAESVAAVRAQQLDCAHLLLLRLADEPTLTASMRLRARYLLGNFEFLTRHYKEAIAQYDRALVAHPARGIDPVGEVGAPQDDDSVARDAAWNRAIALRRLQDQDAGPDADAAEDGGQDGDSDGDAGDDAPDAPDGNDTADAGDTGDTREGGNDGGDSGGHDTAPDGDSGPQADSGGDSGGNGDTASHGESGDGGNDAQAPPPQPSTSPSASSGPPPVPSSAVDLRELDRYDKKAPLDLDLQQKLKERKHLPKGLDK